MIFLICPTYCIVDTVKDVCGHDINFINTKGIIFASTDTERIGDFHEIGKKVVTTKQTIEVDNDDGFYGTHKGVNIPFTYNREIIAAIGISGIPDEVRQYAVLAQKITSLILREQEIDSIHYGKRNQLNYVVRSLIENSDINHDYLIEFLNEHHLTPETRCRTILIKLNSSYNLSNLSLMENHIYQIFNQMNADLYTFNFLNEYVVILPEDEYRKWSYLFTSLASDYREIIRIGIGHADFLKKQNNSYSAAMIAIRSLSDEENIALFDDLDLEIILTGVSEHAKKEYLTKTISKLDSSDLELLRIYFSTDMSLKKTADILFLHKNTLQYKLNRIKKLTGYDPRSFRNAVNLYLAAYLQMQD
ncbi:MAG: sugar diacid recognition domain-containing protein [Eubacteriaceae bacterium]|jgi:carbohydrate diacid regulator